VRHTCTVGLKVNYISLNKPTELFMYTYVMCCSEQNSGMPEYTVIVTGRTRLESYLEMNLKYFLTEKTTTTKTVTPNK